MRFLKGSIYVYVGVPEAEYVNLINATSVGEYLNQRIKGVYVYERIG